MEENLRLQDELKDRFRPSNIIGNSKAMRSVYQAIAQVSTSDTSVLLRGESGTGKELVAHAIHYASRRSSKPFVKVNCAALPEGVIESELFGHEKGAFTGAVATRKGRFELAQGGTLFLDEIGDLSAAMQIKLLRVLQEREFERVGGTATIKVDVRVIAATNRDLEKLIEKEEFRQDLYYRLNVVALTLPPLRDREGDIELLAETFTTRLASQYGLPVPPLSTEGRGALRAHTWPGNVRELRNAIERALVLSPPGTLRPQELWTPVAEALPTRGRLPFPARLQEITLAAVRAMLDLTGGNKSEAARRLGISRPRLQRVLDGKSDE
jgi:Nif-specific regulatory protein